MGDYYFIGASISFILLLNLAITSYPANIEKATGLNTTALQGNTNISAGVNPNQTTESNVVDQSGTIVDVYTNQNSENRFLAALFLLYTILLVWGLLDKIWVG